MNRKQVLIIGGGSILSGFSEVESHYQELELVFIDSDSFFISMQYDYDAIICASKSAQEIVSLIDNEIPLIDLSRHFRFAEGWHYGVVEDNKFPLTNRISTPGCIAYSLILGFNPIKNFISKDFPIYVDTTVGYSTVGNKDFDNGYITSFDYESNHKKEVIKWCGLETDIILHPKISKEYSRGILSSFFVPLDYYLVKSLVQSFYVNSKNIEISENVPSKIELNIHSKKMGASIYLYEEKSGTTIIVCIDNLLKGGVETALDNIRKLFNA